LGWAIQFDVFGPKISRNQGWVYVPFMKWEIRNTSISVPRKKNVPGIENKDSNPLKSLLRKRAPVQSFRGVLSGKCHSLC